MRGIRIARNGKDKVGVTLGSVEAEKTVKLGRGIFVIQNVFFIAGVLLL